MRHFELPQAARKQLVGQEKARSSWYKLVKFGVMVAVVGVAGFFLAFFYQNALNRADLPYRQVQAFSMLVVFVGWAIFMVSCRLLGIHTQGMTYRKLVSILKNEVEVPLDESEALRKQVAAALSRLDDTWALYPQVYGDHPKKAVLMTLAGPGGVYGIHVIYQDPRKRDFVDPAPVLAAGCAELSRKLNHPVQGVIAFLRHANHYKRAHPGLKVFTLYELQAHIASRQETLPAPDLQGIETALKFLANLDSNAAPRGKAAPAVSGAGAR